jgi:hypothetical protein
MTKAYVNWEERSLFNDVINTAVLAGTMWKSSGIAVQLKVKCSVRSKANARYMLCKTIF